jgi:hypothetical protein
MTAKRGITAFLAVAVIIGSCSWIYFTQVNAAKYNVGLHQRVGEVLAEQTAAVVGRKGKVVVIAIETREWPELKTQLDAFRAALRKLGDYELREYEMDTKDQPKYGVGSGLSGRRYVRTVKKNEKADAFVSFVGAPRLTREEMEELGNLKPKLVAETRAPDNLPYLFANKLVEVAVVSRFQFPSPGPRAPKTASEWFTNRFQVVAADAVGTLPPPE